MSTKECVGYFSFCSKLELFAKMKKYLVSTNSQKSRLSITQDLNKMKKIPHTHLVDIHKTKACATFQQKILNTTVVGAHQSFQFFRQIIWFLRNTRALSKLKYWILHHLISIIKLQNN